MQVAEVKTSSSASPNVQAKRDPFFSKEGQDSFFSKSNEATSSFFSPTTIQPKLSIGQPNDKYEVEADAMADKVVQRLSNNSSTGNSFLEGGLGGVHSGGKHTRNTIQTKCATCEEKEKLQKKESLVQDISAIQRKPIFESNEDLSKQRLQKKPICSQIVQPKCSSCDEKEEKLQKKEELQPKSEGDAATTTSVMESQLDTSRGGGSPLSPHLQNDMGSAFGADFGNVRIHTDSNAVKMNKNIGAQAFTHGSDIYFNKGKYNSTSTKGKHLLAHELTHTIQQNGKNTISRATDPEFRIAGKYAGAAGDLDSIYFDYSSSAIDVDEDAKITTLASSVSQDYDLIGFSSEEGGDSGNRNLANVRMNNVFNSFSAKGHTGTKNKKNEFHRGDNKIDYRRLRRVDVMHAGVPPTESDCLSGPVVSCGTAFTEAHPVAFTHALSAYILMIMAPILGEQSRVENAVAAFFGDVVHYDVVKGHLGNLLSQIADQPNTVSCHDDSCDRVCQQADAYMDGNTGPGAVLTLCSSFYTNPNVADNAETLIHEALHATTGLATDDLAYETERGITFLDSATALKNTDSYVLFIKELLTPGSVLGGGRGNRDVIDAAITGTELSDLRRVMAYLEKWVIESTAETSSLYDAIVEAIGAGTWSGVSFSYYEDTMSFLAPLFGLSVPSAVPRENDQVAVAGIYDRLLRMDELLWDENIEIKKDPGPVRFTSGPTEPLFVNDAFLASGQNAMVYSLLHQIVQATTSISGSHKAKYVDLIEQIRVHAGHSAPP